MNGHENLPQLPWVSLTVFEVLYFSTFYPTKTRYVRKCVLAPTLLAIALRILTQPCRLRSPGLTYLFGTIIALQTLSTLNLAYTQSTLPRQKTEGGVPPSELSFGKRLLWTLDLSINPRRVSCEEEPTHALPPRLQYSSRATFIRSQLLYAIFYFITRWLNKIYQAGNPAFDRSAHAIPDNPKNYLGGQPIHMRILNLASWTMTLNASISIVHALASAVSVGLNQSKPEDWPPVFGSFTKAYTLRNFWGKSWHQLIRATITGPGKFLAHDVFNFTPGTNASSYTQLYVAFLISGFIHAAGEFVIFEQLSPFGMRFFLLQAVGITIEDFFVGCTAPLHARLGWMCKVVGYTWVALWCSFTFPPWFDPTSARGCVFNDLLDF